MRDTSNIAMIQFANEIKALALQNPMLPVKAAIDYAEAKVDGREIPVPNETDYRALGIWATRHPEIVQFLRDGEPIKAMLSLRASCRAWLGKTLDVKILKMAIDHAKQAIAEVDEKGQGD